jgi:putative Mn2+ efflux pump MntP
VRARGLALGLSNFEAAFAIGLFAVDGRLRSRVAVIFGAFEPIMPLAGLVVGRHLADTLAGTADYVGGGVLAVTG